MSRAAGPSRDRPERRGARSRAGRRIGGILLAAGGSSRLGRPKQLVPVGGRPLVRHVAEAALGAPLDELLVVLGCEADAVGAALEGLALRTTRNERWREGMAGSLHAGLDALARTPVDAALVLLVDQPAVSSTLVAELARTWRIHGGIVASRWGDVVGPPAVFARADWPALGALRGDEGARRLLRARGDSIRTVPFPEGGDDLDRPEDLTRLGDGA